MRLRLLTGIAEINTKHLGKKKLNHRIIRVWGLQPTYSSIKNSVLKRQHIQI